MDFVNDTGFEAAWILGSINPPRPSLTAIVKGTFRLTPGDRAVAADQQMKLTGDSFESPDPARPLRYPSDFAPFKPRADVLLVGTCYVPGDQPREAARVTFGVGSWAKSLVVYGDRFWRSDGSVTSPAPFTSLPLSWTRAFGGPGFGRNPLGRGFEATQQAAPSDLHPLPNIESADHPVRTRTETTEPAGFGPIPEMWPQRVQRFGTLDEHYLKERWPEPPMDTDWRFFNVAPEDQQIDGYLRGDEELYAENLHPAFPQYRSRLPGVRVRCFLNELLGAHHELREIPMRLDTVWVDMDAEALALVWRGHTDVRNSKLIGTEAFLAVSEDLAQPPANARQIELALQEALARREGAEDELEAEEEPEDSEAAEESDLEADTSPAAESAAGPDSAPDRGEADHDRRADDAAPDEAALTTEQVRSMIERGASFAGCDLSGLPLAGVDLRGFDLRDANLEQANLEGANLSEANFSGAVLAGANLRNAICVGAMFIEADFTGAWLTQADFSGSDLTGADLSRARLRLASMAGVQATDAIFSEADLSDATLEGARLAGADLCDARVHRTSFAGADLTDAALEHAWGRQVTARQATLRRIRGAEALICEGDFRRSAAEDSVWESAQLFGARFSSAVLDGAEFSGAHLAQSVFDAAELKAARFNEAILRGAEMRRCNLLDASLDRADLSAAVLAESNLFGASLVDTAREGASFAGANLKRVKRRQEVT